MGIEERAAQLGKRSIKTTAKQQGIRLAVSMVDLTTLEGADTPGKVRQLCAKGVCPAPTMPEILSVAAICVYPQLVATAKEALDGTGNNSPFAEALARRLRCRTWTSGACSTMSARMF